MESVMRAGSMITPIGRSTGFDYLRLVLSIAVVLSHTVLASYGYDTQAAVSSSLIGVPQRLILPSFFSLSGYLIAGSLFRCGTLVSFAGLRLIRIVPALACEVALSALLLGPAVTAFSYGRYFTDRAFWSYFLNIVGDIHYTLPGVFLYNPYPDVVNVQLWTIPWELNCYLALGCMALLGLTSRPRLQLVILALLQVVLIGYVGYKIRNGVASPRGASGPVLFVSFFAGFCVFLIKDRVTWSSRLLVGSVMACLLLEALPFGNYIVPGPCALMTIGLGRLNPRSTFLIAGRDYSYGIYLYGLPIQQTIASLGPSFQHWYVSLVLSVPLVFMVSALSWHLVEKPALGARHVLYSFEARWLSLRSRIGARKRLPEAAAGLADR